MPNFKVPIQFCISSSQPLMKDLALKMDIQEIFGKSASIPFCNVKISRPTKRAKTGKILKIVSPCLQSEETYSTQILCFQTVVLYKEICLCNIKLNTSYVNPLGKQAFAQTILMK